ncbi:hypothetical protein [Isachenkonia alkalipeptolytica]|uniref:Uncharacterized protein n=1 Tax=Isachenkonia alkalipeptolytica TaxID=2565777 RepID=A0AA44BDE2_9CLOT|nr:hypothetical protein [Isachenkonia alkalipeptolytica]NBG88229.1 hypothetical protein [Isachenkonia alkalipeptolytica]
MMKKIFTLGNWYILMNETPADEIKTSPQDDALPTGVYPPDSVDRSPCTHKNLGIFFRCRSIFTWIIWLALITGIIANGSNAVRALLCYFRVKRKQTEG